MGDMMHIHISPELGPTGKLQQCLWLSHLHGLCSATDTHAHTMQSLASGTAVTGAHLATMCCHREHHGHDIGWQAQLMLNAGQVLSLDSFLPLTWDHGQNSGSDHSSECVPAQHLPAWPRHCWPSAHWGSAYVHMVCSGNILQHTKPCGQSEGCLYSARYYAAHRMLTHVAEISRNAHHVTGVKRAIGRNMQSCMTTIQWEEPHAWYATFASF